MKKLVVFFILAALSVTIYAALDGSDAAIFISGVLTGAGLTTFGSLINAYSTRQAAGIDVASQSLGLLRDQEKNRRVQPSYPQYPQYPALPGQANGTIFEEGIFREVDGSAGY